MIRGLVIVVQALLWLLLLRFLARAVLAPLLRARGAGPAPRAARPAALPQDLVQDRVCRTYVPRASALAARVAGRDEWFCSPACRDKALAGLAKAS